MAVALLVSAATCSSPATSTSAAGPIAFSDATATEGLVEPLLGMYAHAAAYGDVNRDGWPDLFAGGFADYPDSYYQVRGSTGRSPDRLLLGGPDGFTVDTSFPSTFGRTAAAVFADFENTGYPDLVIVRHTLDDNSFGTPPTVLLRNDHGHFATPQPLADVAQGRSPAVLDYDDDGLPDLFISHDDYFGRTGTSVLLHNKGNAQFEDVTAGAGLSGIVAFGATAADLNGDRRPDLLVAETTPVHGPSSSPAARIFTNNGDATFHETPNAAFSWATYDFEDWATGITVADLNRDARPDVVIGHHFESTVQAHTTAPIRAYLNSGLDARGDPTFTDITSASGLPPLATKSPDVQIGDFDNDGWPDLITTASSANGSRPVVFRNTGLVDGVPQFVSPEGLGAAQYWLNAALADIDHDGRLDVFVTDFDPNRPSLLLHNETAGGHWLDVTVAGPGQGLGARVEVYAAGNLGSPGALLGVQEVTVASGLGTGLAPGLHFGIGTTATVDLRVRAARGTAVVDLVGVGADRSLEVDPVSSPSSTIRTGSTERGQAPLGGTSSQGWDTLCSYA